MPGAYILGAAGIQGASSLAGGKKGASAATQASQLQYRAALASLAQQQGIRTQNVAELQPFVNFGIAGMNNLQSALPSLISPIDTSLPSFTFQPTMADLAQTPGYQFTLQQSLQAGLNQLTPSGGGRGWAPIGTAENIAGGIAANTWPQVFNAQQQQYQTNINSLLASRTMNLQQRQQLFNMLYQPVGTGLSAAGALAGANLQSGQAISSAITGAGAAQASGVVGAANAQIGALQGVGGAATNAAQSMLLANALSPGGFNNPATVDAGLAYMQNPSLNVGGTP